MKLNRIVLLAVVGLALIGAAAFVAAQSASNAVVTTPPVYVPDISRANQPMPEGILAWDELTKSTDAPADQPTAHFIFSFTNISSGNVVILDAHGSCSCTVTELPQRPWMIPSGSNGQIGATVDLRGKSGTLFKTVTVSTDKGSKQLMLRINMLPPVIPKLTDEERARDLAAAKIDRQAVFRGDCAKCHLDNIQGKYGKPLYDSICGICHDTEQRAVVVPDLHNLKSPTNDEFWRTWIAHGKPGSLMPAFATSDGGPLSDIQIASIAAYLDAVILSQATGNK